MKIKSLMLAAALAAGGAAFAAAPGGTAGTTSTIGSPTTQTMHAKAKRGAHKMHASARHHMRHGTHAMGAGAMPPATDLDASSRQARIDQAYANWKAKSGS